MITLSIPDMSCGHCKSAVEAALATVPAAGTARVDLSLRQVQMDGTAALPAVLAALDKAGYPASVVQ